jgi:NNP family nitrate/nitrite transporter-like MFS transporter
VPLSTAALLTATFIFPASLLRPVGGYFADRIGPRVVTYSVFVLMSAILVLLSVPSSALNLGVGAFTVLLFALGCAMGIGKASVFKYIPDYFPNDVGAAGGVVGALGALGGFILPPVFGYVTRSTGVPQLAFGALLLLTGWSLLWLHVTVMRSRRKESDSAVGAAKTEPLPTAL